MSEVAIRPVSPEQHDAVMHYFDMVAYADNQRRQGIATQLLDAALEHLDRAA